MYLLDSNIIIYFLNKRPGLLDFLERLDSNNFSISAVSRIEVLMGAQKHAESLSYTKEQLDDYRQIAVDYKLGDSAIDLFFKSGKKLKFKDLIIAATALFHNLTLVTADKDFCEIPGLKVKLFNP